jgi:hypothetical protein
MARTLSDRRPPKHLGFTGIGLYRVHRVEGLIRTESDTVAQEPHVVGALVGTRRHVGEVVQPFRARQLALACADVCRVEQGGGLGRLSREGLNRRVRQPALHGAQKTVAGVAARAPGRTGTKSTGIEVVDSLNARAGWVSLLFHHE